MSEHVLPRYTRDDYTGHVTCQRCTIKVPVVKVLWIAPESWQLCGNCEEVVRMVLENRR